MSGLFGPLENVSSGRSITLAIIGDGRTIDTFDIRAEDPVRQFSVNVSEVTQLEFRFSSAGDSGARFGVANAVLTIQGAAITQFDTPAGTFDAIVTLGQQIRPFRLAGANSFLLSEPGRMMGVEYEHGFSVAGNGSAFFNIDGR